MALTNQDLLAISELMDQKLQPISNRLDTMDNRLDKLESEVSSLKVGQIEVRKDLKEMDHKISDTYHLALDAWGTSTENRTWINENRIKA